MKKNIYLFELSDIFVCLPGGIGTLDEITEVLSTAALGEHSKPIFLINTNNFWSPFMNLLDHMEKNKFIRIGRNKGFMNNLDDLSSLKPVVNNFDQIFKEKKMIISIVALVILSIILISFITFL